MLTSTSFNLNNKIFKITSCLIEGTYWHTYDLYPVDVFHRHIIKKDSTIGHGQKGGGEVVFLQLQLDGTTCFQ